MKKTVYYCILLIVSAASVFSQTNLSQYTATDAQNLSLMRPTAQTGNSVADPQLAMSTDTYLVTAGDIYTLAYAAGTTPVNYSILVDSSYKIRVSNLAVLDAAGKTYLELKAQVETIVSKNYPFSGVQFVLLKPSTFQVSVNGEVKKAFEKNVWGLTRLSSFVPDGLTEYSSRRNITITSSNGKVQTCDLFRAERYGDLKEDPYLRPGDVISVKRLSRSVTISGAVERPGLYQLLDGEGLSDLITVYGSGLTPLSDTSRIELVRLVGSKASSGDKIFLQQKDIDDNFALENYDAITVSQITDLMPVLFVEGAINTPSLSKTDLTSGLVAPEATTRLSVQFTTGENYASLVRRNRGWFSSVSDTANAYVLRQGGSLAVNLNPMLYDASYKSEYIVEKYDILVVPFRQYFVMVSGAVGNPGRYPYIPDRDWSYYVALAGGFDPVRNSRATVTITDITGKKLDKTDPIKPETSIEASNNAFLYFFNQYAPIVTTTLSIITTVFTVIAVTGY